MPGMEPALLSSSDFDPLRLTLLFWVFFVFFFFLCTSFCADPTKWCDILFTPGVLSNHAVTCCPYMDILLFKFILSLLIALVTRSFIGFSDVRIDRLSPTSLTPPLTQLLLQCFS